MSRRSRKGYWPIFLLLMAVGFFVRGGATSTPTRPAGSSPTSRGTERAEQQSARTPTRLAHPVESSSPEDTAPITRNRGQHLSLRVVGVHDGDTLTGLDESKTQFKVRLDAIDAPELGQPFGQAAKKALSEKVFGKDVVVVPKKKDKYGRTVGHVMVGGRDVNLEMLEEGHAWHYEQYDHNKRLREAEQSARAAKKGLWADGSAVPPWDYRKEHQHTGRGGR